MCVHNTNGKLFYFIVVTIIMRKFFCPRGCLDCVDDEDIERGQHLYAAHFCTQSSSVKRQVAWQRLVDTARCNEQSSSSRYLKLKFKETFEKSDGSLINVVMCQNCFFNVMVRDVSCGSSCCSSC
mgnify:CR=1 FL=1